MSGILFTKKAFKKFIAYTLLIVFLYVFRDFLGIFFLTFIFAYLFFSGAEFLHEKLCLLSKKYSKVKLLERSPLNLIVIVEYLLFIGLVIFFISNIVPSLKEEITDIITQGTSSSFLVGISNMQNEILHFIVKIDPGDNLRLFEYVEDFFSNLDLKSIGQSILNNLGVVGGHVLQVLLALVLSFIFIVDRKRLKNYLYTNIKESNFGFIYNEYEILLEKVVKSFGLIIKAQSMIAFVNSVLTVIGLFIIGFLLRGSGIESFPYILTLWLMVFVFGFIPVFGVMLSSIPIMIVAYTTYGTFTAVGMVVVLILVVHSVEAYYLNPKIVSTYFELPVSLSFVVLIVSEHFFGFAGLLIGISLFYFLTGLLKDFNQVLEKKRQKKIIKKLKKRIS